MYKSGQKNGYCVNPALGIEARVSMFQGAPCQVNRLCKNDVIALNTI